MNTSEEQAIREVIEDAVAGAAPTRSVRDAAIIEGRRLRTRRRIAGGLSAAAVTVAAVAVAPAVVGALPGGGDARGSDQVANQPSGPPPTTPPAQADPTGWWDMPASQMADTLSGLLPEGVRLTDPITMPTDPAPGQEIVEQEGYLIATLRPATGGPGRINVVFFAPESTAPVRPPTTDAAGNVTVWPGNPLAVERISCAPEYVDVPAGACRQLKDALGETVGRVIDHTENGVRDLMLDLITEDGGTVMFNVANTLDDKWPANATASAENVPLTLAQLRAIASDPVWTSFTP